LLIAIIYGYNDHNMLESDAGGAVLHY
jgi:hypothetical protein